MLQDNNQNTEIEPRSGWSGIKLPAIASLTLGLASVVQAADNSSEIPRPLPPEQPHIRSVLDVTGPVVAPPTPTLEEQHFDFQAAGREALKGLLTTKGLAIEEGVAQGPDLPAAEIREEVEDNPQNNPRPSDRSQAPENETEQATHPPAGFESNAIEAGNSTADPVPAGIAAAIIAQVEETEQTPAVAPPDPLPQPSDQNTPQVSVANPTTQARDFGIALTTIGLGVLSVLAAVRGVVKGSIEVSIWRKSIQRFNTREFTDMVALNAYSLIPCEDGYTLQADTKDRPLLTEFLGGNRGARNYFVKAAKLCTYDQPLICLEFPRDYEEHWMSKKVMKVLTAPIYYASFKNLFARYHNGPHPNEERFAALNRINKLLREAVSASYNGAGSGLIAKQFQKELPVRYFEKAVYVIPLATVAPPGVKHSRSLSVATISAEDFERFGNPEEVARIKPAEELYQWHIDMMQRAFKEHQAYQRYTNRQGKQQELFPRVRVAVPCYKNRKDKKQTIPDQNPTQSST